MKGICLICGEELPEHSCASKKYCARCAAQRNRELSRERQRKAKARRETEQQIDEFAKDRAFCRCCIYYGTGEYSINLCDYFLDTGRRRGCKYGRGCTMRIMRPKEAIE